MNIDNLNDNEIKSLEAEIEARKKMVNSNLEHYGSVENLNDNEINSMEAEIQHRRNEVKPTFEHYGSAERLSDNEINSMEAEIQHRRNEVKPTFEHYGSAESLSDNEINSMEAEIQHRRNEVKPTFEHYGSVESMDNTDFLEAQRLEQKRKDIPYKEYLSNLINDPTIYDEIQFNDAVNRSMESNVIMKQFCTNLVEEISKSTYAFKKINKTDLKQIETAKEKTEKLVNVYIKYLYELKKNNWNFSGPGNNIGLEMIDSDMLNDLWQVQKEFGITFNMPIPNDLGEYYGKSFERQGKMVPGITLIYDDLKNKQVNWHQVLIYKENELTPKQRYMQRKEEEIRQFELARQKEINNTLTYANNNDIQVQIDNTSMRK